MGEKETQWPGQTTSRMTKKKYQKRKSTVIPTQKKRGVRGKEAHENKRSVRRDGHT